jgi:outer membrane lipoprotein-sorting protein
MTGFRPLFVIAGTLAACGALPFGASAADSGLETVFARMDKAATTFKSMSAGIKRVTHTELVNANEIDEGTIAVKRSKPTDTRMLIDFQKAEPKKVFIGNGKVLIYTPNAKVVQEGDLGKNKNLVNEFLLLGFGSTSTDLKKHYTVAFGGPESINGTAATRIELIPTSKEILNHVKKAELWIPENGVPIQQKFYQSGGDYQVCTYSKPQINPNLPDLKLDLPKGVKTEKLN